MPSPGIKNLLHVLHNRIDTAGPNELASEDAPLLTGGEVGGLE
jgi:hypothetical protein